MKVETARAKFVPYPRRKRLRKISLVGPTGSPDLDSTLYATTRSCRWYWQNKIGHDLKDNIREYEKKKKNTEKLGNFELKKYLFQAKLVKNFFLS